MGVRQIVSIKQTVGSETNDTVTKAVLQHVGSSYEAITSPKSSQPPTTSAEIQVDHGLIPLQALLASIIPNRGICCCSHNTAP